MNFVPRFTPDSRGSLVGAEGELVSVQVSVAPRLLEGLLEALADLPFPVNPEIYHGSHAAQGAQQVCTVVEFPAFVDRLPEIEHSLTHHGFDKASMHAKNMLEQIRGRGYNTYWNADPDLTN